MPGRSLRNHSKPKKRAGYKVVFWIIGLVLAFGAGYVWHSWRPGLPSKALPLFEESVSKDLSPLGKSDSLEGRISPERQKLPLVAIVIDDLGYQKQLALDYINLDLPVTLSFLPQAPFAKEIAKQAFQKGKETMLHLPMEPKNYPQTDPGPEALLISMSGDQIQKIVQKDLEAFPWVTGVNNHMGSRFTEDPDRMTLVLKALKAKKLFFLDSRTSPDSAGLSVAARLGVKAIGRDIFLDNIPEEEAIQRQLEQLIQLAQEHGLAVGCGHPYPQTLKAIKEKISELRDKVRLVPLSGLLARR